MSAFTLWTKPLPPLHTVASGKGKIAWLCLLDKRDGAGACIGLHPATEKIIIVWGHRSKEYSMRQNKPKPKINYDDYMSYSKYYSQYYSPFTKYRTL